MCGITGWICWETPPQERVVRKMTETLRHRGPDYGATLQMNEAVFGHRRLSVLDLSDAANQPMTNSGSTVMITFNGEIYNFKELKVELEAKGHKFDTQSDTEVLLKSYIEWGPACVTKLQGMFAFAIWDDCNKLLFLARDRLGEKPIYIYQDGARSIVFASELKSLMFHPEINRTININALNDFLALSYISGEHSILENVIKLSPAHFMLIKNGAIPKDQEYWSP